MTPDSQDRGPIEIRPERPGDARAIHRVNREAFGQPEEADLVDRLRAAVGDSGEKAWISLVARRDSEIIGHILFTEVTIRSGSASRSATGLAPMAVLPGRQRQGIGSKLVEAGLAACRAAGHQLIVVLGHPAYYPRFGFTPAIDFGLRCEYDAPSEAFMALELEAGALAGVAGTVCYRPEFRGV